MRTLIVTGSILIGLLSLASARAQTAPPPPPPPSEDVEAVPVEELVIRGRLPGPAWWRVSNGDATVFVLGMPEALPKGMEWDTSVLKRRLAGANALITPPVVQASISLFEIPKLLFDANSAGRSKVAIDQRLPEALAGRLERAAVAAGESPDAFAHVPPWIAGVRLAWRYHRRVGLDYREPLAGIRKLARDAGVKAAPADSSRSKASALLQDLRTIPDTVSRRCVEAVVTEVETGDAPVRAAARAWASGDVRMVLDRPRSSELCFALLPGAGAAKRDALDLQANAIQAALEKPGHAVAALSLRSVVARGGVLERLRARGLKVEAPE